MVIESVEVLDRRCMVPLISSGFSKNVDSMQVSWTYLPMHESRIRIGLASLPHEVPVMDPRRTINSER